jgi:thioredoxin 1
MSKYVKEITDASFKTDVLESDVPVLVDFWAEWCGPCKAIAPILEDVAKNFDGKVSITKLNVDESPEMSSQFGVMSIPTLILFKNGNIEATKVGAVTKSQLTAFIEGNL